MGLPAMRGADEQRRHGLRTPAGHRRSRNRYPFGGAKRKSECSQEELEQAEAMGAMAKHQADQQQTGEAETDDQGQGPAYPAQSRRFNTGPHSEDTTSERNPCQRSLFALELIKLPGSSLEGFSDDRFGAVARAHR